MPYRPTTTVLLAAVLAAAGCSRFHYRERTDKDVEGVITQKNVFPAWAVDNWHVYPDPRARYADPSKPDFPPYPPDDYAAYVLSPNPQRPGRGGIGRYEGDGYLQIMAAWDATNRAEDKAAEEEEKKKEQKGQEAPESPSRTDTDRPGAYRDDDPANPDRGEEFSAVAGGAANYLRTFNSTAPRFRIRFEQAIEMAVLNAREFQDRREDLYLAALPVTLERFQFAAQAFAAENIIRQAAGRDAGGNLWQVNNEVGLTRTFATGAQLVVSLATQIVVNLGNGRPDIAVSDFSLTMVQPLLQGGGFAVTLENLTQTERTLVYAIRSFMRFRRVFYYAIAGGGGYTNNPYGLQGLSANLGRGVGANLTSNTIGYLPSILRAALLDNARKNAASFEQFLRLFQNLKEGGGVTELQVVQVEQNLIDARQSVLDNTRLYFDNLDTFKLQLGLPTTVPIELDDGPLKPIRKQLNRFEQVYAQLKEIEDTAGKFDLNEAPARYRERWANLLTNSSLVRGTKFAEDYKRSSAALRTEPDAALDARLAALGEQRRKLLDAQADRQLKKQADTPAQLAEIAAVETAADRIRFEQALRTYESRPWKDRPVERAVAFRSAFETGMVVAVVPRNERLAGIRSSWPALPAVTVDGVDVLRQPLDDAYVKIGQAALTNRLDLMNSRAQVVDAWRQITVVANSLQGVFDVSYNWTSSSPANGDQPLLLGGTRNNHQVALNISPPFVRRLERNNYRAALISYQRSRRNLMSFEDNILLDSRTDLRNLRQLAEVYALQQRLVELSYAQVDNARQTFTAPPDPGSARGAAGDAAALTQQLVTAQTTLLRAQNNLYTTYTSYLTARIELYLDLELLPLDARGIWTDEPPPDAPQSDPPAGPGPGGRDDPAGGSPADPKPEPERLPAPAPVKND
jgi:outer membrane protein TolC